MLNLCDSDKFFTDPTLQNAAKRKPVAVEDIEIIGQIFQDESIDFPALSGSCKITKIASLTTNFNILNSVPTLTVKGNGSENPNNPRQPSGEALIKISGSDPDRFDHGWYSINTNFTLGTLLTNSNLKLDNIGYNNFRTECLNITVNNSIVANNVLSVSGINFINSKAYDCQFTSYSFNGDSPTKMDNVTIQSTTANYNGGKYLEANHSHQTLTSNSTRFLSCSLTYETGTLNTTEIFKSNMDIKNSGNLITCNIKKANITSDNLLLNGGESTDSSIIVNRLSNGDSQHTSHNTVITCENIVNGNLKNSGILSSKNIEILKLDNYAQAVFDNASGLNSNSSIINNFSGALITFNQDTSIKNGNNKGTIIASYLILYSGFFNDTSGIIISDKCVLTNNSMNNGKISNCSLSGNSTNSNSGDISNGFFYNQAINNGKVGNAEFYDSAKNISTGINQGTFYSGSINEANFSIIPNIFKGGLIFKNNSISSGSVANASFYDNSSQKSATCYNTNFFNTTTCSNSLLIKCKIHDSGKIVLCSGQSTNFFNNSSFDTFTVMNTENLYVNTNPPPSGTGSIYLYDNASGNNLILNVTSGLDCHLYNNSIIDNISGNNPCKFTAHNNVSVGNINSTTASGFFLDNSSCGNSLSQIYLLNSALASGNNYSEIIAYDTASIIHSGLININFLTLNNNTKCLSQGTTINSGIFLNNSFFSGSNIINCIVSGKAKIIAHDTNIVSTKISFIEDASNTTTVNSNKVLFSGNSINNGIIKATQSIFTMSSNNNHINGDVKFLNGSTHRYTGLIDGSTTHWYESSSNNGSGNHIMHFGPGSINNGYAQTAYFYEGSANAGKVNVGVFHPSVTTTGIVNQYSSDETLNWSPPEWNW